MSRLSHICDFNDRLSDEGIELKKRIGVIEVYYKRLREKNLTQTTFQEIAEDVP